MELQIVDPKEFGIEESKAKLISEQFKPMLDKMVSLETEANEVFLLNIEEKETASRAKELRLKYVKVRTGTAEIHKQQKAFYLQAGRFVDGWKNAQLFASQGIEEKLEAIEKHAENLEKEAKRILNEKRIEIIRPYVEDISGLDFSDFSDENFDDYVLGKKTRYNEKIEAEKQEAIRIENERLAEIERQRLAEIENEKIRVENARLQKEAEEKELALQAERKLQAEKEAKLLAESNAKLKAEQDAKSKIEAELQAKKDAETKAENERLAKIESDKKAAALAAKAPIKKQLSVWVESFELPIVAVDNETSLEIKAKFEAFKKWSQTQIKNL